VGLVDDLPRDARPPVRDPHIHPLEGRGEALAKLGAHHDPVGLAGLLSTVDLHATLHDHRFGETPRASPAGTNHPGDLQLVSTSAFQPGCGWRRESSLERRFIGAISNRARAANRDEKAEVLTS
jgi:hypothetical protein